MVNSRRRVAASGHDRTSPSADDALSPVLRQLGRLDKAPVVAMLHFTPPRSSAMLGGGPAIARRTGLAATELGRRSSESGGGRSTLPAARSSAVGQVDGAAGCKPRRPPTRCAGLFRPQVSPQLCMSTYQARGVSGDCANRRQRRSAPVGGEGTGVLTPPRLTPAVRRRP